MAAAPIRVRGAVPQNVDVVADAIRDAIVAGRLMPGERIKEVPIAEQLGVSRGPIREAITRLAHEGLLATYPNRGAVVPEIGAADVLEVYAMRASLGSLALQRLLLDDSVSPASIGERELDRVRTAVARGDEARAAAADLDYQSALVAASGLPRVVRQFEQLTWQVRAFIAALGVSYAGRLGEMLTELTALDDAITGRRNDEAQRLWREKLERWVRDFTGRLEQDFDAGLWVALTTGTTRP